MRGVDAGFSLSRFTMSRVAFPLCTSGIVAVEGVRDGRVGWNSTGIRRGHVGRQMRGMSGMKTRIVIGFDAPG